MAEAVMVLPVLVLLWVGLLHTHRVARHVQAAVQHARAQAWRDGFNGCLDENEPRRGDCPDGFSLDLAPTGKSVVDEAGSDLLGRWTSFRARTALARPPWLGGGQVRIGAAACVPCNPLPKASFEVVRRIYDDSQ